MDALVECRTPRFGAASRPSAPPRVACRIACLAVVRPNIGRRKRPYLLAGKRNTKLRVSCTSDAVQTVSGRTSAARAIGPFLACLSGNLNSFIAFEVKLHERADVRVS